MPRLFVALAWIGLALSASWSPARGDDADVETVVHSITGLFQPDRVEDFREVLATMPEIELVEVNYEAGEATLRYNRKKVFSNATDAQVVQRLDGKLRGASRSTFGAKPRTETPREQLTRVEIGVVGCKCKGCNLAAYETIYKLEGVERATASFHDGLVVALIDPAKTNRETLEEALRKRNVTLKSDEEKKAAAK